MKRQIVLDTETTGLEPELGHRIIEIGCIEMVERRLTGNNFHQYLQPDREIDVAAVEVHGISNEFLADKPKFTDVMDDFIEYVRDSELIIHNAPFDVGFINYEFSMTRQSALKLDSLVDISDTLVMAKKLYPGQRNSLDALCKRYGLDLSRREKHGALLDAELLADVYLLMTGGQDSLLPDDTTAGANGEIASHEIKRLKVGRQPLKVVHADEQELAAHKQRLANIGKSCLWCQSEEE